MQVSSGSGAVPAPPRFADPRRIGALVGLVGAFVFVFSYSDGLGAAVAVIAKVLVVLLILAAVAVLFVRPRWIGPFVPPKPLAIGVYLLCVVGEFALIALGTRALIALDLAGLRPALIALVVGVHFLPFAWAFGERMFVLLGTALFLLGAAGLLIASDTAAQVVAVASGLVMAGLVVGYGLGAFARAEATTPHRVG